MPLTCVPETDVVLSQSATKVTHREKQKSKVCYFVFTFILTVDSCFSFPVGSSFISFSTGLRERS